MAKVEDCLKEGVVPVEDEVLSWATKVAVQQSVQSALVAQPGVPN